VILIRKRQHSEQIRLDKEGRPLTVSRLHPQVSLGSLEKNNREALLLQLVLRRVYDTVPGRTEVTARDDLGVCQQQ
jgi:hypothetical protein